jgi:hypothetical protein
MTTGIYPSWHEKALVTLSEGFCPDHLIVLAPNVGGTVCIHPHGSWLPGGWCPQCRIWWHLRKDTDYPVCAIYPMPEYTSGWPGRVII